jgi:MOSC domain-containing protein YiiM
MQINVMSARAIALIAQDKARWPLAGDQLFVDLDLSDDNLPPWTRLQIGSATIEVTDQPHTGCGKFVERFGLDAMEWVNSPLGRALRLRGLNAKVVQAGTIRVGEPVRKIAPRFAKGEDTP